MLAHTVKLGRFALDGTKVKTNASKHKALSYRLFKRIEVQLHDEVKALAACGILEARVWEWFSAESHTFEEGQAQRKASKDPRPPSAGSRDKGQVNLTDEESCIMPVSDGGIDQCFNAQAGMDIESTLVLGTHLGQTPNGKQQLAQALAKLMALPADLGQATKLSAGTG